MKQINNRKELDLVVAGTKPVLLDFYADWCSPCIQLSSIIDTLAEEYKDLFEVAKIDIEQNQDLAQQFEIMAIPSLIFMKNGVIQDLAIGLLTKPRLENKINQYFR